MKKYILVCLLVGGPFALPGCSGPESQEHERFAALLNTLALAWSNQDTELALSVFNADAVYMEPPDIQLYRGHAQLRPYFDALTAGTTMKFHNLFYNANTGIGGGEYTFGHVDSSRADVGVAVIELRNGKISVWREYQRKGPADFSEFISADGKTWQWHIGNYP